MEFGVIPGAQSLTILACDISSWNTLNDWSTHSPAVIALVVAMAGMILPAISAEDLLIMIPWTRYAIRLTLDIEFRLDFNVEDSSSEVGRRCNKVQSVHVVFIKGQNRRGLV
jgi:hypothetical protein